MTFLEYRHESRHANDLCFFRRAQNNLVLYQSLGVQTGGTIALMVLHRTIARLGFNITYCDERNRYREECSAPGEEQLLITGEWCRGVLEEYGVSVDNSSLDGSGGPGGPRGQGHGRGLQYHLGFHHHGGRCKGHVAMADSHYLHSLLGPRALGAYFLGCPMTDRILEAYQQHLIRRQGALREHDGNDLSAWPSQSQSVSSSVEKENLILFDPDYLTDYPPEDAVHFAIPDG